MSVSQTITTKLGPAVILAAMTVLFVFPSYASNEDIYLQCDGEARSRLLAFTNDQLEIEQARPAPPTAGFISRSAMADAPR